MRARDTAGARGCSAMSTRKRPARLMNVVSAAPLVAALLLLDLHDDFLPLGQELADVHPSTLRGLAEVLLGDFLQRQESMARGAVINEARFRARARRGRYGPCKRWLFSVSREGRSILRFKQFLSINQSDAQLLFLSCIH